MTVVGVVPAAGYALRLQPLPHSKEMLQVGGRPIMDYLVDRMRAGGAEEIRVVTRREKEDVIAHCERLGASVVLADRPRSTRRSPRGWRGSPRPTSCCSASRTRCGCPRTASVASPRPVESGPDVALGLFDVPGVEGSDYLVLDESGAITDIDIKPVEPRSTWIWGCAAARARALEGLADVEWPSTHMLELRARGVDVAGVPLSSVYLDIGTPSSLERVPGVLAALSPQT